MSAQTVISCDACGEVHRRPGDAYDWDSGFDVVRVTVRAPGSTPMHKYACSRGGTPRSPSCLKRVLIAIADEEG